MATWGNKLQSARRWDDATRTIMLASKSLPILPPDERTKELEVKGCEANVWMRVTIDNDVLDFAGYSDGKIVRGLMQIISEPVQGAKLGEFVDFNFDQYLTELGLQRYLSPSRSNGVSALVARLKAFQAVFEARIN